jgi:Adenylate and Guanylate cyclase catalytic domain
MARRGPPRKVTYFEPVAPCLARNTIIESTFEVGRRFRCTLRISGGRTIETTGNRRTPMRATGKPFDIEKKRVYEAYKAVKSNGGAAGVDGQTIERFEADLLLVSGEDVLQGSNLVATVLFSDIRRFATLSEAMTPPATVTMLNEYFTAAKHCGPQIVATRCSSSASAALYPLQVRT